MAVLRQGEPMGYAVIRRRSRSRRDPSAHAFEDHGTSRRHRKCPLPPHVLWLCTCFSSAGSAPNTPVLRTGWRGPCRRGDGAPAASWLAPGAHSPDHLLVGLAGGETNPGVRSRDDLAAAAGGPGLLAVPNTFDAHPGYQDRGGRPVPASRPSALRHRGRHPIWNDAGFYPNQDDGGMTVTEATPQLSSHCALACVGAPHRCPVIRRSSRLRIDRAAAIFAWIWRTP